MNLSQYRLSNRKSGMSILVEERNRGTGLTRYRNPSLSVHKYYYTKYCTTIRSIVLNNTMRYNIHKIILIYH